LPPAGWSGTRGAARLSVAAGRSDTARTVSSYQGDSTLPTPARRRSTTLFVEDSLGVMMASVGRRVETTRRTRLLVTADAASRLAAAAAWLESLPADAGALVIAPAWEACGDLVRGGPGSSGPPLGAVG